MTFIFSNISKLKLAFEQSGETYESLLAVRTYLHEGPSKLLYIPKKIQIQVGDLIKPAPTSSTCTLYARVYICSQEILNQN